LSPARFSRPRRARVSCLGPAGAYFVTVLRAAWANGRPLPWITAIAHELVFLLAGGFLVFTGRLAQS